MKWVKRGIFIAFALAIVGAIAWGFVPKPVPSEFATAAEGDIRVTIDEEGITRVKDRFVVTVPLAGAIDRVELKVGDHVEEGALITTLRPTEPRPLDARALKRAAANVDAARATFEQAKEALKGAETDLALAERELERLERANKDPDVPVVSAERLDQARTRVASATAKRNSAKFAQAAAEAQLEAAKATLIADNEGVELKSMPIRSPVAGRVLTVYREHAGTAQPGEALVEVGNPESLEVAADLLSRDAVRVQPGMSVHIERWGGSEILEGEVRTVEPVGRTEISALGVEEQRVNVIIDFTSGREMWGRLGDGYRVEARIIVIERPNVVKVPGSAIFNTADGPALFKVSGGRAQLVQVELGERTGIEAEVRTSINPGETVIIHPSDDIRDGTRVVER